jgi:uncharacterized protein YceK
MMKHVSLLCVAVALSGCGMVEKMRQPKQVAVAAAAPAVMPVLGQGQSAAALDKTSAAEKAAAVAAPLGGAHVLGTAVVSLGSPAEQGFWLKTSLVVTKSKGRVEVVGGKSVAVDLLPSEGAASLSLAAFRVLGLGLTDLPEVTIYAE